MRVAKTVHYGGTKIYVLQHNSLWQYYFHYKGELYMQHCWANPSWWRWLLLPFGGKLYDEGAGGEVEKSLLAGATASIDELKAVKVK